MGWGALLAGEGTTEPELELEGMGTGLEGLGGLAIMLEGSIVGRAGGVLCPGSSLELIGRLDGM